MIGDKKNRFFFTFLKKCNMEYTIFSYNPNTTKSALPLIPGRIAAIPMNIPNTKPFKTSPIKCILKKQLICLINQMI